MGVFIAKSISLPILALSEAVSKSKKGEFDISKDIVLRKDEVGILARAFIKMSNELAASYRGLEEKVKERTLQVEEQKKIIEEKLDETKRLNDLMIGRELTMVSLKEKVKDLEGKIKKKKKHE